MNWPPNKCVQIKLYPIPSIEANLVGGWTNPSEKCVSKWESSPGRGENKTYLKPPPSNIYNSWKSNGWVGWWHVTCPFSGAKEAYFIFNGRSLLFVSGMLVMRAVKNLWKWTENLNGIRVHQPRNRKAEAQCPRWPKTTIFWGENYIVVSKNRGIPKWMIYNGKPYIKMDDLGVPLFSESSIWSHYNLPRWY